MQSPQSDPVLGRQRPGRLRLVRNGALQAEPIAGLPPIYAKGIGGLMDIALHPRFAGNSLTYLYGAAMFIAAAASALIPVIFYALPPRLPPAPPR